MTSSIKQFTLVTATMMALVMGSGLSARTTSAIGQSVNPALGSGSSMWTWPIDKEARSQVWTDARSAEARSVQVGRPSALRKSAVLGGL
jgi:hypothetical protein